MPVTSPALARRLGTGDAVLIGCYGDPNAKTPANTPDRLTATSSVRARYWDEAIWIELLNAAGFSR